MPDNTSTEGARATASDIKVTGDPDVWELVCKASSVKGGWAKSTKRMTVPGGAIYQVTTEHRDAGGVVTACAEAVCFVPAPKVDTESLSK